MRAVDCCLINGRRNADQLLAALVLTHRDLTPADLVQKIASKAREIADQKRIDAEARQRDERARAQEKAEALARLAADSARPGEPRGHIPPRGDRSIDTARILAQVAFKHKIAVAAIVGPARYGRITRARFEACFRLRTEAARTYPEIARKMGGRDHTTIMNAVERYYEQTCGEGGT